MKQLAVILRAGQLYAHSAHNIVVGPAFFGDHEFLGETYAALEGDYDDVVERAIGLGRVSRTDLIEIQRQATAVLPELPATAEGMLAQVAQIDRAICQKIEKIVAEGKLSQGTINLIVAIADRAEKRWSFLISQRLTKTT
jgi:DNA-binding ferritin-like protein